MALGIIDFARDHALYSFQLAPSTPPACSTT